MSEKIRKYIIPNIPYLLVWWFCLKVGTAYRIADGDNVGFKLMNTIQGLGSVLADIAPSTNAQDWLVGITGAVLLRIVIYNKVKKAKKYRRDVEYGSARWSA